MTGKVVAYRDWPDDRGRSEEQIRPPWCRSPLVAVPAGSAPPNVPSSPSGYPPRSPPEDHAGRSKLNLSLAGFSGFGSPASFGFSPGWRCQRGTNMNRGARSLEWRSRTRVITLQEPLASYRPHDGRQHLSIRASQTARTTNVRCRNVEDPSKEISGKSGVFSR